MRWSENGLKMNLRRRYESYTRHRRSLPSAFFIFAYLFLIGCVENHAVEARNMTQAGSESMRVVFATSGGVAYFPGLARPVTIDAAQLPEDEARKLADLVAASRFFDQPGQAASRMGPPAPPITGNTPSPSIKATGLTRWSSTSPSKTPA
jgi:hypothetical protein